MEFKEKLLMRNNSGDAIIEENEGSSNSPQQQKKDSKINTSGEIDKEREEDKNMLHRHSHYEELVHPNMEQEVHSEFKTDNDAAISMRDYERRQTRDCKYYFSKLDYEILRPLLIYKYERDEMHRQDDLHEMMEADKNLIGSIYGKIDNEMRMSIMSYNNNASAIDIQASRVTQIV
jgi:hypothetical protein